LTRFDAVRDALADLGSRVRDDILRRGAGHRDAFRFFAYGYGLRSGDGVADLAARRKAAGPADRDLVPVSSSHDLGDPALSAEAAARLFDRRSSAALDPGRPSTATPRVRAAEMVRIRFARLDGPPHDGRTLLVICGGDPTDGDPRMVFEELLKAGINI